MRAKIQQLIDGSRFQNFIVTLIVINAIILVTTLTMLNLFIAIIVNAMHSSADESAEADRLEIKRELSWELAEMEQRLIDQLSNRR